MHGCVAAWLCLVLVLVQVRADTALTRKNEAVRAAQLEAQTQAENNELAVRHAGMEACVVLHGVVHCKAGADGGGWVRWLWLWLWPEASACVGRLGQGLTAPCHAMPGMDMGDCTHQAAT